MRLSSIPGTAGYRTDRVHTTGDKVFIIIQQDQHNCLQGREGSFFLKSVPAVRVPIIMAIDN